ncbi:hypothetical protein [Streptomyces sp. NBC_01314]|uniref:hypothetical protein n=1 Tax=Streptomyces sp. NBC_01314 TaxID=2903821 RepID=UPI00308A008E|nr:hypothetical protein OG622_28390 [Streptomyces sp. NBC_01314]
MSEDRPGPECRHWIGSERRHCRAVDGIRPYIQGLRCPLHTPNALAGKPEAPPGPGLAPGDLPLSPLSASVVADTRAIASGKRRSTPAAYRAAQAAVDHRRDLNL